MMLCKWEELPEDMQTDAVKPYYDILKHKQNSLLCKRIFDFIFSFFMLIFLSPVFLILGIIIKIDSKGPIFYRQIRITQYGKPFRIHKFRSMVVGADQGSQVTMGEDCRVTRVGKIIRRYRFDEIPQLVDVMCGAMTFVGVRPEVPQYVEKYSPEMKATLLLPAGVTNLTSIYYANEANYLNIAENIDEVYIQKILPEKMFYNLKEIRKFSFWRDIKIMFITLFTIIFRPVVEQK